MELRTAWQPAAQPQVIGADADHRDAEPADPMSLLLHALDEIDYGVLLVDDTGRLRFANQAAWRHSGPDGALRIDDGHVQLRDAEAQRAWPKALWQARQGARSLIGTVDASGRRMVAVIPMRTTGGNAVLLLIGRPQLCEPLTMAFFARAHHLSNAETSVLQALTDGLSPAEIARRAGVAITTVRTQIGSLRAKTGAASIRALIGQVAALPPIVPALRAVSPQAWRAAA